MTNKKVVSFGEILFRITPYPEKFAAEFSLGGAELNVATALATWGADVSYISCLPDNVLSTNVENILKGLRIDTSRMIRGGERIGIYYMAPGGDMQSLSVVYDRKWSAFSQLLPGTIDWGPILDGVSWLHWTAITPALNANAALVCEEMLQAAQQRNITISTDLNFRRLLWKYGKTPVEIMPGLLQYCDVVMGNIWAATDMLGIEWDETELVRGNKPSCSRMAGIVAEKLISRFPACKQVAFTYRFTETDGSLNYFATLFSQGKINESKTFHRTTVIDSVGSGDSFMAGLIYGRLQGMPDDELVNFAAAAAVSKLYIKGDANTTPLDKVKAYLSEGE